MRAARLVTGLLAAFLLGLVLVEPRLEPIWAESEEPPLEEPFPVEPEQVGPPVTTELHAGLWRVDGGFVSTIRIKNSLVVAPLEVTPILYMADGTPYTLPPVSLPVSGVATVNINEVLAAAPPEIAEHDSSFGSAALRYSYPTRGHVLGSIEVLDFSGSLIFTYPFSGGAEEGPGPQTFEGVWWRHEPEVGGFVSLANTTGDTATAAIQVLGSRGTALLPQAVEIAPHATVLLDLDALTSPLPGLENQAGGIRVQFEGRPGDILVTGGLVEPSRGYSANLRLWPRSHHAGEPAKNTYAAVGLMVGAGDVSAGFPGGTIFSPYAVLRNTTSKRLAVRPEVSFMAGSQPVTRSLPPQQLLPFETRRLAIEQFLPKLGLKGFSGMINFAATFEGQWDDLLLTTGSTDQSGNFVFEVEPQGVGASFSKEGPYWKAADGFDTVVTLWNPTDQAQDFLVTFYYGAEGQQYKLPVPLAAKASRTISVAEVIAAQQPDADGNVIPLGTREGSMVLSSAKGMTKWMTLVASTGILNVAVATCGTECWNCCGYSNFRVEPEPGYCLVASTAQCNARATYCDGQTYTFTGSSNWESSNTAILTVNNTTQKGLVTGVSPGTADAFARFPTTPVYTGTICMQPCPTGQPAAGGEVTSWDFTVNISPSTIRPKDTGGTTTTTVTVQTNPFVCKSVSLEDQRIHGSGGHPVNHPTTLPSGTGGTFNPSSGFTNCTDGKFTSTYTARIFGGEHQIKATMQSVTKTAPITLRAMVSGLGQLTSGTNYYNSNTAEGQIAHPDNWWGTSNTRNGLVGAANACAANANCQGSAVPYNDISLRWGGKFDGNNFNWTGGHNEHRDGREVDVNVCHWTPQLRKDTFENILYDNGAINPLLNTCSTTNTWHVRWP